MKSLFLNIKSFIYEKISDIKKTPMLIIKITRPAPILNIIKEIKSKQ